MHSITAIVWFLLPCLSPLSALIPLHLIGAIVLSAYLSPKAPQTTLCASMHSSNTVTDLWNYNNCAAVSVHFVTSCDRWLVTSRRFFFILTYGLPLFATFVRPGLNSGVLHSTCRWLQLPPVGDYSPLLYRLTSTPCERPALQGFTSSA